MACGSQDANSIEGDALSVQIASVCKEREKSGRETAQDRLGVFAEK